MIIFLILIKISLMIYYSKIDLTKGIDITKGKNSKECIDFHYCYFNCGFKFHRSVCNGFHVLMMSPHINIAIITMLLTMLVNLKILCLMIVDLYKMHFKETYIKNRVCNYYFD